MIVKASQKSVYLIQHFTLKPVMVVNASIAEITQKDNTVKIVYLAITEVKVATNVLIASVTNSDQKVNSVILLVNVNANQE